MAKRKRFFQKRQTVDSKPADTEKVSENVQPTQDDILKKQERNIDIKNKKTGDTSTSFFKPAGIIKYVYLIVFFALLAGIMAPIVNPLETGATFEESFKGIGILFVGLAGGILIFKATTSIENRMTFLIIGFALMIICSVFMAEFANNSFFRGLF
tara:strand:- start:20 stop:484 length:465 start_codon:yes stop_codon:yes gene_type:complete